MFNFFFYFCYYFREIKYNYGDDLIVEVNRYVSYIFFLVMEYIYLEDRCVICVRIFEFFGFGFFFYYFFVGGIILRYVRIVVYKIIICFELKVFSG